ncbi:unnamed protein product [Brassica oleracea]
MYCTVDQAPCKAAFDFLSTNTKLSLVVLLLESKAVLSSSCVRLIFVTSVFWDGTQESEPVLDCDIL